ncbi:MAG: acetyl-CoA carboxylase biotin carboxyl carrier protein subunit [Rhodospirillales bacterium]|jgi:acetyl-CoA carboxylase biotin carboxyl carrier protein
MADVDVKVEITGSVWKIVKKVGDKVEEDDEIMILESMKMEIPVLAPEDGTIKSIIVKEGDSVVEDQTVATLEN